LDVLTDVLAAMRLSGAVFLEAEFSAPWCVRTQLGPDDCQPFFARPTHIIAYHFVTDGTLICEVDGGTRVEAVAGDIVLLTRNDPHVLGSEITAEATSARELLEAPEGGLAQIRWGGGGERTGMFCGFLGTDSPMSLVLSGLPSLLKISTPAGARRQWLISSLHYAAEEARAGSAAAVARLVDLLFAEAVRQYAEALPTGEGGWFAALRDPAIGHALTLVHERFSEDWTTDLLAREVGMSRSAFADRFTDLMAEPPMRYCARWRMQVAANLLRDEQQNIANTAYHVGFNSEAAFSRAFKREYGLPPAQWRKQLVAMQQG
jgi:AraC-like DNA-binding protein